jgi:mannose-6-phosphate isomerase-like protein (cupin superfamily)
MLIRRVDPDQLIEAYDVKEQVFYPWPEVAATPFGSAWLVVEPGRRTKPHNHHERETFFILRGSGRMTVGDESREVGPGDVIYLPAFGDHILENLSPRDDLHFLSIWWEDPEVLAALRERTAGGRERPRRARLSIAVRAGGAGGGPAGAELDGPRLGAEIQARFARLQGARVRLLDDDPAAETAARGEDAAGAALALCERLQAAGEVAPRSRPARLIFALAGHEPAVRRHSERVTMSPRLRALVDLALERGLPEIEISRPAATGVTPPVPGLAAQRFDPGFVRAARLLAAAATEGPEGGAGDEPSAERPIVFLGVDQAYFYAVVLPALADAAGAAAGWGPAALIEADAAGYRWALAGLPGAGGETPAGWRPWLRGLAQRVAQDHQGLAPPTQAWTGEQQRFTGRLLRLAEEAAAAYQPATFSPGEAARVAGELVRAAAEFAAAERPWRGVASRREERNTGVALELLAAKLLALAAYPLAPEWSSSLWRCLGYSSRLGEGGGGEGDRGDGEGARGDGGRDDSGGGAGGPGETRAADWEAVPSFVPTGAPIRGLAELAQPAESAAAAAAAPAGEPP